MAHDTVWNKKCKLLKGHFAECGSFVAVLEKNKNCFYSCSLLLWASESVSLESCCVFKEEQRLSCFISVSEGR